MDILYIVGPPGLSKHGNQELRWSLRSVAKYARNVGRVIVAGYPPPWLSDAVVKHDVLDRPGEFKFRRIWRCAFAVIDAGLLKGEFLVSFDDNFYTAPVDVDATPFWRRRPELLTFKEQRSGGDNYRRSIAETRRCLIAGGYPINDCACHRNTRLHAADAEAARALDERFQDSPHHWLGLDLEAVFVNVRAKREAIRFADAKDWKCEKFDANAVASGQFSIGDGAFDDPKFRAYMDAEFGVPCVYERS